MDPVILVGSAISLATPFLIKTGEKIAETIGEDIWNWIRKPFTNEDNVVLASDYSSIEGIEALKEALLQKVLTNPYYQQELEAAVNKAQQSLSVYNQQNITNNNEVQKQINISNNSGSIQM